MLCRQIRCLCVECRVLFFGVETRKWRKGLRPIDMNSFTLVWERALSILEEFYSSNNNRIAYDTFIKLMEPAFEQDGDYYFKVGNAYFRDHINMRFASKIENVLSELCKPKEGHTLKIVVMIQEELDERLIIPAPEYTSLPQNISLNKNYTFSTFVVGNSNKLAHAASQAVANSPGKAYNPLFIYGGVGLGKTHLMHAIGNEIYLNNPEVKIIYITSESFTNEFIDSIQKKTNEQFRNKYRSVDVLLIDDIQFISKATQTQEEIFHTFNTLYESNKQIILSSDKAPSEIPRLEERLLSRFQWGLLTDISLPDYETRVAILKNKIPLIMGMTHSFFSIEDEVIHYIASKENTNIRDLEGALKKVIANAQLVGRGLSAIDMTIAHKALRDFFSEPVPKTITPKLIVHTVCEYFGVTEMDILGKRKNREVVIPRQITMYLLRRMTELTHAKVGEMLGGRDHSTVMHADEKISKQMLKDSELQNMVNDIMQRINE